MRKWLVGLLAAGLCAASAWATDYTLVESADDLTAGSYVITGNNAADGAEPAMLAQAPDKNYFYPSNVSVSDKVISDPDDTLVWEVAEVSGGWTIHSGVGYVSYSGSGNTANAADDVSDSSTWTISVADGVATVANKGTADRKLQYNSGSPRFACYTSNQKQLKFYKAASGPVEFSIKLSPAENFEVVQNKSASITATVRGAQGNVTYSWSVNGTPIDLVGNVYEIDSTEVGGPYEVACAASDGVSESVSASVSYTVVEAPVVTGDQLTRETTGVTGTSYKDWTATGDSGTVYAGNSAGGNSSIQLNTGSPKGIVITESTGKDVASVTVEWNDATVAARSLEIYGSANAYEGPADLYGDSKGELLGTIARDATTLEVAAGYPYVGILAKGGALYLSSVTIGFAGEAGLSVSLDKANGFTVDLGTADSITATAKNGTEPYSYVWTSDTPDLNGTGDTLAIPATLAEGDYTVQVEVTDADSNKASKQIGFSVVAPLEPHAINIAVGIQNGTVTSDPEGEAVKGTQVKLTATATTEGYALKEMTVTYGETVLTFTTSPATFEMPDEAVSVGAVFAEVKDYATLPFYEGAPYTGPWQKATIDGLTSSGLGTDYMSGGVPVGAKFDTTGDWMQIKFDGTPGELVYAIKGNSISETNNSTFLVQESATGADDAWSTLATYKTEDGTLTATQTGATNELSASSRFVRFIYDTKGAGNVGIYGVYISSGGPAVFSISLDPASYFEVDVGEEASIAATPKNAEGEVHYSWTVGGEPAGSDSAVLGLDTTAATDELEVVCNAQDAANTIATAKVSYKVVAKYQISCAVGIPNGSVSADKTEAAEGELVTLTANPAEGYKLEHFLMDGIAFTENPFPMPARDVLISASFVPRTDHSATYTVAATNAVATSGAVPQGSSAEYSQTYKTVGQATASNSFTLVLSGYEETTITGLTLSMKSNKSGGGGSLSVTCGDAIVASIADSKFNTTNWYGDWSQEYVDITPAVTATTVDGDVIIKIDVTANSLFLQSVTVTYEGGTPAASISYTGETTVEMPGSFALQFLLVNGGDEAFEWSLAAGNPGEISSIGEYTWTPDEAGKVTITVNATRDEELIASTDVTLTVNAQKFAITIDENIENGRIIAPAEAEAGATVSLTADPDAGYRLVTFLVDGEKIGGNSFVMPAKAVVVSATFELKPVSSDKFKKITDLAKLTAGEYVITGAKAVGEEYAMKAEVSTSSTAYILRRDEAVTIEDDTVTDAEDSIIWTLAQGENGWTIYNESVGYAGYVKSGNSAGAEAEPSTKSSWTITASETEGLFLLNNVDKDGRYLLYNASSPRFACYTNISSGKQLAFYKKESSTDPYIEYTGETTITVGETFELAFELQNFTGGEYSWSLDPEVGAITAEGNFTWTPDEATRIVLTVSALAESGEELASVEVLLLASEAPAGPALVFGGDSTGTVGTPVNFTVAAVNVSDPTVYLDGFEFPADSTLTGADISLDYPNVGITPDVPGTYVFNFSAGEEDTSEYVAESWTVTVAGGSPVIDSTTVSGISLQGGLSGKVIDEALLANFQGVEAYVGTWNGSDWDWAPEALANEAAWPDMKFSYPEDEGAILRLHFLP